MVIGPRPPPLGAKVDLRWKFQMNGLPPFDVHVADCSGQNFRDLFGAAKVLDRPQLPEALREVADFCQRAEIVVLLVNLGDFMGDADPKRRIETEWTLKLALQALADQPGKHVALVFTQADLYPEVPNHGGASPVGEGAMAKIPPIVAAGPPHPTSHETTNLRLPASSSGNGHNAPPAPTQHWLRLAQQHLPVVYAAYLANHKVKLFAVSAINRTCVVHDGTSARRVPDPEFESEGLDELGAWMFERARRITYPPWWERGRRLASSSVAMVASAFTFSSSANPSTKGDTDHGH